MNTKVYLEMSINASRRLIVDSVNAAKTNCIFNFNVTCITIKLIINLNSIKVFVFFMTFAIFSVQFGKGTIAVASLFQTR